MQEIIDMISTLVKTYEKAKGAEVLMPKEGVALGKCPVCGKVVVERPKSYSCSDRGCKFTIWMDVGEDGSHHYNLDFDKGGKK